LNPSGTGALTTFSSGGFYNVKLNDAGRSATLPTATGAAGSPVGWDNMVINSLSLPGTQTFTVNLISLSGTTPGSAANFDPTQTYNWTVADVQGLSFTAPHSQAVLAGLVLNTAGFSNAPNSSFLSLTTTPDAGSGTDLVVNYNPAPEPTSLLMFGLGAAGLMLRRRRRTAY
jgi:hypothetical protein